METYGLMALGGGKNSLGLNGHYEEVSRLIEELQFEGGLDVEELRKASITLVSMGFIKGKNFRHTMYDDYEDGA